MTTTGTLVGLPDCKLYHPKLTVGKTYAVLRTVGINGLVIELDDGSEQIIILKERLA